MALLKQNTAVIRLFVLPGGAAGWNTPKISKDGGAYSAPSDGAIILDLTDVVAVSFDSTDTDTIGDLALQILDGGAVMFHAAPDQVATMPLALVANDGSADLLFRSLTLDTTVGPALVIKTDTAGAQAVSISGDGGGILISSAAVGIDVAGGSGVYAMQLQADAGLLIAGAGGPGVSIGGTGAEGLGISASSAAGVTITGTTGVQVAGSSKGATVSGTSAEGLTLTGGSYGFKLDGDNILTKIANALLDLVNGVETGLTLRQTLRLCLSVLCGKAFLTGATRRFRNPGDTTDRVTATTDTQGQRTAVTLNP